MELFVFIIAVFSIGAFFIEMPGDNQAFEAEEDNEIDEVPLGSGLITRI